MISFKSQRQLKSYLTTVENPELEMLRIFFANRLETESLMNQEEMLLKELISWYSGSAISSKSGSLNLSQKEISEIDEALYKYRTRNLRNEDQSDVPVTRVVGTQASVDPETGLCQCEECQAIPLHVRLSL
jgi:hypothetical protein